LLIPAAVAVLEMLIYPRHFIFTGLQAAWYAFLIMFALWLFGFIFGFMMHLVTGKRITRTILGFGDVEIATLGGLILGLQALGPALLIMVMTGGIGALLFIFNRFRSRGRYRAFSAIPYGPYICLGVAVALFMPTVAANLVLIVFGFNPFS
jgi:prepilin signal peptidase PulO-like enzyme (type II secretory pathway)